MIDSLTPRPSHHHRTTRSVTARHRPFATAIGAAVLALGLGSAAVAQTITLKASHQFPGGKGDVRDEMVQMIARDVAAAKVGVEIKVFPGSSLVKAQEQWKAMLTGQIDMTSFPLDYASGFHPQFGATLMPGLVKGHAHARRINDSAFMKDIKAIIEQGGAHVLADAWLAGAFGSKDRSTTPCSRGWPRPPTPRPAVSCRSACTSNSSASRRLATTPCGSCTSPC
jgi:hypothetical protein